MSLNRSAGRCTFPFKGRSPTRFHDLLSTAEHHDSKNLDGHFHMDIPLMLARELTGFRHDEFDAAFDGTDFGALHDLQSTRRGWMFCR